MTTWIIDVRDKVGQRVQPYADVPKEDRRFRKIVAYTFIEALTKAQAQAEVAALLASEKGKKP